MYFTIAILTFGIFSPFGLFIGICNMIMSHGNRIIGMTLFVPCAMFIVCYKEILSMLRIQ